MRSGDAFVVRASARVLVALHHVMKMNLALWCALLLAGYHVRGRWSADWRGDAYDAAGL